MKTDGNIRLRFTISLLAYAVFLLKPAVIPDNPWQDFVDGSLAVAAVLSILPVVVRGPSMLIRISAFALLVPAASYLAVFLYSLIYDMLHGGRHYAADA